MTHGGKRDGAGRKAGTPNKITGDLKAMILEALDQAGGVDYLAAQAKTNPNAFAALLTKLIPTTLQGDRHNPLHVHTAIERVIIDPVHDAGMRKPAASPARARH